MKNDEKIVEFIKENTKLKETNHTQVFTIYELKILLNKAIEQTLPIKSTNNCIYTPEFIEWIGKYYIRLNKFWVRKYNYQTDKNNWRTTEWLYDYWKKYN